MDKNPENTGKLEGVQIVTAHISEYVRAWVDAITSAGAIMEDRVGDLTTRKSHKIGVIIGPTNRAEREVIIRACEEKFGEDISLSIRYFLLTDRRDDPEMPEHHRARPVFFKDIAPNDLVDRVNRSLYKARLPLFLRTGYNVEICEKLLEIGGIKYRKIILRSYKMVGKKQQTEYESLQLYIHNKELYEIRDGVVAKIPENGSVTIRPGKQILAESSRFDAQMPLSSLKNSDSDE